MSQPTLGIVVPCFNEEEVLPKTSALFVSRLDSLVELGLVSPESFILFCNDGSTDKTWDFICSLAEKNGQRCRGLSLSRNRGHQNALLAGLMEARALCDVTISIDADGQDDVAAMEAMVRSYLQGNDIVYGVRNDRSSDTPFKRTTAQAFYGLLNLMGVEAVYNHADYRLMSKRALDALALDGEVNLFLRGMVPLVGYKSTTVGYSRHERLAGKSHYPLSKMISLAIAGITSMLIKPIRIISVFGLVVSFVSFIAVIWAIASFFAGKAVAGWASTVSLLCFLSGVQIMSIGVIGEYVGRTYLEAKGRPRYIIAERTYGPSDVSDES